jgi:hypothetical protein
MRRPIPRVIVLFPFLNGFTPFDHLSIEIAHVFIRVAIDF